MLIDFAKMEHGSMLFFQDSLESKETACREFFDCLNKSLEVLGSKLPTDARCAILILSNLMYVSAVDIICLLWMMDVILETH